MGSQGTHHSTAWSQQHIQPDTVRWGVGEEDALVIQLFGETKHNVYDEKSEFQHKF